MSDLPKSSSPLAARLRRSRAVVLASLGASLVAGGSIASSSAGQVTAHPAKARVVAIVQSASGGHLFAKPKTGGRNRALHKHDKLNYGDHVLAGRGAKATFKVTVPKGDPGINNLIDIKPLSHALHTITVARTASVINVTLR